MAAALLVGCASTDSRPEQRGDEIVFMIIGGQDEREIFRDLTDSYNRALPPGRSRINMIHTPDAAYLDKLKTQLLTPTPPDIFFLLDFHMVDFAEAGVLQPLEGFVERDPEFDADDFFPQAFQALSYEGHLYGIPRDVTPLVIFYNQDIFDEEGIPYPTEGWSWDELVTYGRKLVKRDAAGRITRFAIAPIGYDDQAFLQPFTLQNGAAYYDEETGTFSFDQPRVVEAWQFLADWSLRYRISPFVGASEVQQTGDQLFASERVAIIISGRWMVPTLRKIKSFRWDAAPMFHNRARATTTIVSGYFIARGSPRQEEAWEFIKFITGKEGQRRLAERGLLVPSRKSVAYSDAFIDPSVPPASDHVFLEAIEYGYHVVHLPGAQEFQEAVLKPEVDEIFYGMTPAAEAMRRIQAKAEAFTAGRRRGVR